MTELPFCAWASKELLAKWLWATRPLFTGIEAHFIETIVCGSNFGACPDCDEAGLLLAKFRVLTVVVRRVTVLC